MQMAFGKTSTRPAKGLTSKAFCCSQQGGNLVNPLRKQYEQHAVFQRMADVRASLSEIAKLEIPDDASKAFVERISQVLDEVSNRLEVASPYLVRMEVLNNLQ